MTGRRRRSKRSGARSGTSSARRFGAGSSDASAADLTRRLPVCQLGPSDLAGVASAADFVESVSISGSVFDDEATVRLGAQGVDVQVAVVREADIGFEPR